LQQCEHRYNRGAIAMEWIGPELTQVDQKQLQDVALQT
jgi:hypothetical protein